MQPEIIVNPPRVQWEALCARNIPDDAGIADTVAGIINQVRQEGDSALLQLAQRLDGADLQSLTLDLAQIDSLASTVPHEVTTAMEAAARNIRRFHEAQIPASVEVETVPGVKCVQRPVPIRRVGIYIPGGRAPLFSTVLMLAIPAVIAGCPEVALFTPSGKDGINPYIAAAAKMCGITEIHPVGGAQAVAAMAYGTRSIKKVDKIFGPGNRYVTKAKQMVSSAVAIDMPAGPSEVMVLADHTAVPAYCAADLLSQAEHGPDSQAMMVCTDTSFARETASRIQREMENLPRRESVEGSLSHSRIIVLESTGDMVDFANAYAAEHLILSVADPWRVSSRITSAGSIFIGNTSPESAGDYASGTNHTLPTAGWAASMSGVNTQSFMHMLTIQELTSDGLRSIAHTITTMALAEGLQAHARAVQIRLEQ